MAFQLTQNNLHRVYSVDQVRKIDRSAITEYQISGLELMRRAGRAAFEVMRAKFASVQTLIVVVGSGNNGGDGYIVAYLAARSGVSVSVLTVGDMDHQSNDARAAREQYLKDGHHEQQFDTSLLEADVLIDALLGTGLNKSISAIHLQAVKGLNSSFAPVMSLDVPSGLNANTGIAMPIAVQAKVTVTFVGIKPGLLTGNAADHTGLLYYDALGIPISAYKKLTPLAQTTSQPMLRKHLPLRSLCAHKTNFGHALLIGSGPGYPNAIRLAAQACARTGAGVVSVATHADSFIPVSVGCPSAIVRTIEHFQQLDKSIRQAKVIAVGPGFTTESWARDIFNYLLTTDKPLVVDADALTLLAQDPCKNEHWVLTPHPGEAARLLNCSKDEILHDRIAAARAIQQKYGGTIVLKGAGTIIYSKKKVWINQHANSALATAGTGDVLTGIITGLLAQGMSAPLAAACGVYIHSRAAELASNQQPRGTLATDLMQPIRKLVNP